MAPFVPCVRWCLDFPQIPAADCLFLSIFPFSFQTWTSVQQTETCASPTAPVRTYRAPTCVSATMDMSSRRTNTAASVSWLQFLQPYSRSSLVLELLAARKTLLFLPSLQTQSLFSSLIHSLALDCVILSGT